MTEHEPIAIEINVDNVEPTGCPANLQSWLSTAQQNGMRWLIMQLEMNVTMLQGEQRQGAELALRALSITSSWAVAMHDAVSDLTQRIAVQERSIETLEWMVNKEGDKDG